MPVSDFESGTLGILAILVVLGVVLLHYLLFKEYLRQEKIQVKRIKDLEKLVNIEIYRSRTLSGDINHLHEIKSKTDEKLEIIKLQVEGMKGLEKRN